MRATALIAAAAFLVAAPALAQEHDHAAHGSGHNHGSHSSHAGHAGHARGAMTAPQHMEDHVLHQVVDGAWRPAEHKARDQYRHPGESLTFWGLRPGLTVVEIGPGGEAWWTQILAPYAARTGGTYVAALQDRQNPALTPERKAAAEQAHAAFVQRFGNTGTYGTIRTTDVSAAAGLRFEPNSADMILVARAFHNWAQSEGTTDRLMASFFAALKPGGVLAVEQHRAPEGADPKAGTGYVPESYVIEAARKAGFVLDARSEVNANPRDARNHPYGVWTLKPTRVSAPRNGVASDRPTPLTEAERAAFDAIGESDRMTLRFRKPS